RHAVLDDRSTPRAEVVAHSALVDRRVHLHFVAHATGDGVLVAFRARIAVEQGAKAGGGREDGLKHDAAPREQPPLIGGRERQGSADAVRCAEHGAAREAMPIGPRRYLGDVRPVTLAAPALALFATGLACHRGGRAPAGGPSPGVPAPAPVPPPPPPLVLRAVQVGGTSLQFVERGAGTPLVLVHGTLETLDSWRPQIDAFATRFRVIAYSRRYHPPNAPRPDGEAYSLSLHADDLIRLIEALGLERVHLVGSCYGAYVALLVTMRRPDLVRSLVVAEPPIIPWLARTPEGDSL